MDKLSIEVVYATREVQEVVQLTLAPGARAIDALRLSGLQERHPGIDTQDPALGIFGNRIRIDTLLEDGDRVEVYRRLIADPKETRRRLAAKKRRTSR